MSAAMHVLRIIGLAAGGTTPFDGKWVVEYDPERAGVEPGTGMPMRCHLKVTDDPTKALKFDRPAQGLALYQQSIGTRPDGRSDRPLTAFSAEVESLEAAERRAAA